MFVSYYSAIILIVHKACDIDANAKSTLALTMDTNLQEVRY